MRLNKTYDVQSKKYPNEKGLRATLRKDAYGEFRLRIKNVDRCLWALYTGKTPEEAIAKFEERYDII